MLRVRAETKFTMNRVLLLVFFSSLCSTCFVLARRSRSIKVSQSQSSLILRRNRQSACKDVLSAICPSMARRGLCNGYFRNYMAIYCKKSCPQHCKKVLMPDPIKWFRIYSTSYRQCLTLGFRISYRYSKSVAHGYSYTKVKTPVLYTTNCRQSSSTQSWHWTANGQLRLMYNRQCLTYVGNTASLRTCNSFNRYQKWTCRGHWLSLRTISRYVIPVRARYSGYITIRTYPTTSSSWVRYGNRKSLCEKGVVTTSKPSTPPLPTTLKPPPLPTTLAPPPLPTTIAPPPLPLTDGASPPPILLLTTLLPPPPTNVNTPPIPTTPKPSPPPSNRHVMCGTKPRAGMVVNGTKARVGSWPWQIGIRTCADCKITCGGTLINDEWIVTAAHCVTNWSPGDLFLVAGEIDQDTVSGNEQHFKCKQIVIHEQYAIDAPYDKDIALLQLDKYALFNDHVRPLCLPDSSRVLTGQDLCTVTGFGSVKQTGPKSSSLLQANVKIVPRTKCNKAYMNLPSPKVVTQNMVCAGYDRGGTDACQGDSGGPLTCFPRFSTKFILGGIVSWGVGCAKPTQYGVYSNVAALTSWIKEKLPT